ncbi:helix-turn-helix domain-containing protein [Chitinophaga sp.]|uniref:helix-turn-helix domain-containing protein n=1 Tax=Chitinophaga sp. TaxID=1869181 RepID=UPI0039C89701
MDTNKLEELKLFGNKLRQLREQKGWSLRQMATNCSIDFSNLGQMEKGRVDVRFSTILELAKVLDVTPCELFDC